MKAIHNPAPAAGTGFADVLDGGAGRKWITSAKLVPLAGRGKGSDGGRGNFQVRKPIRMSGSYFVR